jgi:lipopolysaccharide biosynthesis glycosyltransferase
MDSDIYLRRLPDPLFTLPLSAPIAATPGCTHGDQWFAGGFLVLTPSEMVAAQMLHALDTPRILATYPRHTCTGPFFDDQRFLNGFFKGNYTKLDRRWNFATHYSGRPIGVDPDVNIHFTGRNKPAWHNCQHGTYDLKTSPKALLIAHKALNTST